jgi:dienelactone hydrolase
MWDLNTLSKTPKTYPAPGYMPVGDKDDLFNGVLYTTDLREKGVNDCEVRTLFYDGVPFKGKPTRVFAYYGAPKVPPGTKVPAMVLVHGGGGTAYESWVRLWNARGYAAISMDLCGCVSEGTYPDWKRHDFGGPAGWGGFEQIDWPAHDQWTYHAVADVILANSLLRSFPEVDPQRIGITGVSWGGYLTCIAAGVDRRFKFAVPVYGCGFLGEDSVWLPTFAGMGKDKAALWLRLWDPSVYLAHSHVPMLWVTSAHDFAYPIDSLQQSYRLAKGRRTLCIRPDMEHGHGGPGETPEEIHAFADSLCKDGIPLPSIRKQGRSGARVWADFSSKTSIAKGELNFTKDKGEWSTRKWETIPAVVSGSCVSAVLPLGTTVYYLNIEDARNLLVSAEHAVLEPEPAR